MPKTSLTVTSRTCESLAGLNPLVAAIVWAVHRDFFGEEEQVLAAGLLFVILNPKERQYLAILRNGNMDHKKELRDLLESERMSWLV